MLRNIVFKTAQVAYKACLKPLSRKACLQSSARMCALDTRSSVFIEKVIYPSVHTSFFETIV